MLLPPGDRSSRIFFTFLTSSFSFIARMSPVPTSETNPNRLRSSALFVPLALCLEAEVRLDAADSDGGAMPIRS